MPRRSWIASAFRQNLKHASGSTIGPCERDLPPGLEAAALHGLHRLSTGLVITGDDAPLRDLGRPLDLVERHAPVADGFIELHELVQQGDRAVEPMVLVVLFTE